MPPEPTIVSKQELGAASQDALNYWWDRTLDILGGNVANIPDLAVKHGLPAVQGLLALFVAYFIARYVSRICSIPIRQRIDETLGKFVGKFVFYVIMVATIVWVIGHQGYSVTSFAAVLAAAGFAIGLAFQGTLSNFAAGILLLVFRPFKVGDKVVVAGMSGTVHEIDLFSTAIDTGDNRRIILPNSSIAGNTIENTTHHLHRRIEVSVGIAYDNDLMASRSALSEAAESLGDLLVTGEGRGYQVTMEHLGPHSVDWSVKAWVKTSDTGVAKEILTVAIKENLDASGLRIPFPQLDIHWENAPQVSLSPPHITTHNESSANATFAPRRRG